MSAHAIPLLTPEQYLAIERAAELKNEYYDGVMYAMAGASPLHVLITSNLNREFGNELKKSPCLVLASDQRVRIPDGRAYCYPDIAIVCDTPRYADDQKDTLLNPVLLVEVLSASTEGFDRGGKAALYRAIETLTTYVLVSQTEPRVETYRRQGDGSWLFTEVVGLAGECRFEGLDGGTVRISMAEIYAKADLVAA